MIKKIISVLISLMLLTTVTGVGASAFAEEGNTDNSALLAALARVESYEETDYTPESYAALYSLYEDCSQNYESYTSQEEIDDAVTQLLEAISDLMAYLNLTVSSNNDEAALSVAFGGNTYAKGVHTVVYSTPVTLTAPALQGYSFAGWFETVSKRMLSEQSTYTFNMTVKTSLRATYYSNAKASLTFSSYSGQVFTVVEKTAEEWAEYEDLDDFVPSSVPYRYGYINGRWVIGSDVLSRLASGESVTVTPEYDSASVKEFASPAASDEVVLKLHYRYDSSNTVGSFVMKTAVAQGITPEAVGMLFYYKNANSFDPTAFDVNINNKMLTSQFTDFSDDEYITNMKKLTSGKNWAVKGYFVYNDGEKLVTVYSNQVNVVNTVDIHEYADIEAAPATCTESGNTAGSYCDICATYFDVEETAALGHNYEAVVTAPTCTEGGYTTYTCSRCGDTYTADETAPLGHNYELFVTEPTCTEGGYTTYTCSRCGDTYTADETAPLGHSFGEWVQTTAPTCTEAGEETRTCSVCGATETQAAAALGHNYELFVTEPTCTEGGYTTYTCSRCGDTYTADETAPLGHNYELFVTEPTCTEGGYTTYTCSRCGDTYTADETAPLGHSFGEWTVTTAPTATAAGEKTRTCSRCNAVETQAIPALNIVVKLPNVDSYLYRAGNANNIALSSLFEAYDANAAIDGSKVAVTFTNIAGTAAGTFTANTSDWTAATVKLTGTGVTRLTVKVDGYTSCELYLEVVAGTNYAEGATLANITSNNAVLLGDVNCSKITINNKKTLYGNGFSVTDTRTDTSGAANSYITMNGGGSIDNAKMLGQIYASAITSGQTNQYYAPGIWITGDANIYNSYVSETKNAVQIDAGTIYFENTTFSGGAIANVDIGGGDVTLKNCVTQTSDRGGLKGIGIRPKTSSCKIHLLGTFTQYNYLTSSDLPGTYKSILNSIYSNSTYAYTYSGSTYLNMGIFFVTDSGSITAAQAAEAIDDQTGNSYGYVEKTVTGLTGTLYTRTSATASPSLLTSPAYDETVNGQYPIPANETFDYTTKNYIARTTDSNLYCYYDNTTKKVLISFDKENSSSHFDWDPMILTATKLGNTLPYTVSMNNTDYTNGTISFTEEGDYQVVYTFTDPYNYDKDGNAFSVTYTRTVDINVTAVEPDVQSYPCSFVYDGAAGSYSAKQVIGTDNKTYVMPDVSSTSSTIGSTTVGGRTVYYPIVTVGPTTSNGNTAYSSGKGYYFAPVFSEIHIVDYNQETGAQQYEYSKSTSTWPHGNSATTGPNTAYFTCASGEKTWSSTSPYARSMNSQYYKYGKNNLGVCYTSNDIEKDNTASNHLVQYHYVSNDGTTYYYYVYYKFSAMTYSSCVTTGTLVTMADGTQKPVEDVKVGDMVMTWSMWNGCYEAQSVVMHWYHGTDDWQVLTLNFSDGTQVNTIKEHGFYDSDRNTYAYITPDNVEDYIGDSFIKQNADGTNTEVTLSSYSIQNEVTGSYSIQTAFNENFIVEGMLSMTGEDYRGRFEYFDIGDDMKYDEAKMQADIERYGLYSYEDFSDYLTPEQFAMFNGQYFKILVGKGVLTYDDILGIIEDNLNQ